MKNQNINTLAIVGSQWGDEGKGKITDYFAQKADVIVRWCGGDNAGHTVVFDNKKYALSLIPSGIFNQSSINIIGNGCVINLRKLVQEIDYLKNHNFNCDNLKISNRAHLILPYHTLIDELQEKFRGENSIGTTKKGIGPAYQDKAERIGVRVCDLFDPEIFNAKLKENLFFKNQLITKIFNGSELDMNEIFDEYLQLFNKIKHYVTDTSILLTNLIEQNKKVLFEGSQGVMLDLDHGTYPFVTSSNPTASSIPVGTGIANKYLTNILGITKAYNTRVGSGGFPSEMQDPLASIIREKGKEYGVVSGRARRIGWFDAVMMKHSLRISGITGLAITLLDVLSEIETLKICVNYKLDGKIIDYVPATTQEYERCEPVFIEIPGWSEDISNVTSFKQLPINARNYLNKLSEILAIKIDLFSVGPNRTQTILQTKLL